MRPDEARARSFHYLVSSEARICDGWRGNVDEAKNTRTGRCSFRLRCRKPLGHTDHATRLVLVSCLTKKAIKFEELWNEQYSQLTHKESMRYDNLVATVKKERDRNRVASHGANTAQSLVLIANSSWKFTVLLTQCNVFDYRIQPIWNS